VTGYRLDSLGIKSRWGKIFCIHPEQPWGPSSLIYNGYRVFWLEVEWLVCDIYHPPSIVPRLKKERSYATIPHQDLHGLC
jgi:hypothetical protein